MGIAVFAAARIAQAVPAWIDLHWPQRKPSITSGMQRQQSSTPAAPHESTSRATHKAAYICRRLLARLVGGARQGGRSPAEPAPQRATGARPLRVLRVVEPQQARSAAGRMVISGRMADVCAELDRLAAAEAASAPRPH